MDTASRLLSTWSEEGAREWKGVAMLDPQIRGRRHPHALAAVSHILQSIPGSVAAPGSLKEVTEDALVYVSEGRCPCDELPLGPVDPNQEWVPDGPYIDPYQPPTSQCPECRCAWGIVIMHGEPHITVAPGYVQDQ